MTSDAPKRLSRGEAKARTRELLLEAAASTFARKGFHGASVEAIAEAAGFSIGALYANFAGKEQLFLELLSSRASGQVLAAAEILHDDDVTAGDPADALGRFLVDLADKDTDFSLLQAEFWLYAARNPGVRDTLAERMREPRELLARLVEERRGEPEAPVPPSTVATVVLALFQGLVRQRRIDQGSVPPELFGQALRWLFAGLDEETRQRRDQS
ncbi:TetR/AcrR family transcriptional regulator [Amycolatopsis minnesotensis]|uniref:TetR/AcrR family transcriptional regulator n=1 Tax=Amycolatopsis minnesotensis TaxID=337894 RepID=UPI0031D65CAB